MPDQFRFTYGHYSGISEADPSGLPVVLKALRAFGSRFVLIALREAIASDEELMDSPPGGIVGDNANAISGIASIDAAIAWAQAIHQVIDADVVVWGEPPADGGVHWTPLLSAMIYDSTFTRGIAASEEIRSAVLGAVTAAGYEVQPPPDDMPPLRIARVL